VAANVAFGLTPRSGPEADRVVRELLDRIGLGGRGGDYPHHLSGGERQRVALARALAPRPRLLLMDEPFTSLDGTLRGRLRAETVALLRETRTTTVLVTHDADEALRVADRVALIDRGRLVECGTPHALYARPATVAAARLFGEVNEIRGICRQGRVHTPIGCFDAPDLADRAPVSVCIRPSHVRLGSTPTGAEALVLSRAFLGHEDRITVAVPGLADPVAIRVPPGTRLEIDDVVRLDVDPAGVVLVSHVADSSSTPLDIQGV
jgi:iron(III) transport system ATP-binding protein